MKLDKNAEARILFQKYAAAHPDNLEKFRGLFWAARMIKNVDAALSKQEFIEISKKDLLGFYGLLSLREMNEPIPPSSEVIPTENSVSENDRILIDEVRDLILAKENSIAAKLINYLQIRINRYSLYAFDPELVFPKLYPQDINQASLKAKIPTELLYSIIRQESSFDSEARSQADALGLMQLLPSVAENISKKQGLQYRQPFDLFIPSINVPIGAFELKSLLQTYDDHFILAVARYNASEEALNGWLKLRYSPDPVEFIEDIGYDETRNYVKLVMRNFISYQRLNAKTSFSFPEALLKWDTKLAPLR